MLLGMEGFLMALAVPGQRAGLLRLLEFCEEVVYRYAVAQVEQGAHMTSIGDFYRRPGRLLTGGLPGARLAG